MVLARFGGQKKDNDWREHLLIFTQLCGTPVSHRSFVDLSLLGRECHVTVTHRRSEDVALGLRSD